MKKSDGYCKSVGCFSSADSLCSVLVVYEMGGFLYFTKTFLFTCKCFWFSEIN